MGLEELLVWRVLAALLLQEVGEPEATTHAFIAAVVANNGALQAHKHDERREANLRRREGRPHEPRSHGQAAG